MNELVPKLEKGRNGLDRLSPAIKQSFSGSKSAANDVLLNCRQPVHRPEVAAVQHRGQELVHVSLGGQRGEHHGGPGVGAPLVAGLHGGERSGWLGRGLLACPSGVEAVGVAGSAQGIDRLL